MSIAADACTESFGLELIQRMGADDAQLRPADDGRKRASSRPICPLYHGTANDGKGTHHAAELTYLTARSDSGRLRGRRRSGK